MNNVKRRAFLSQFSCALGTVLVPMSSLRSGTRPFGPQSACWLDVTAPFVLDDPAIGIRSELVLTSDTFSGTKGYEDSGQTTEYEVLLYDLEGKPVGKGGVAKRLTVPAMHTTTLSVREILGGARRFFGGARVRLRPGSGSAPHASDLFSSAFLRLSSDESFDIVHANPDPLQWQRPDSFYYSMPFPSLGDYACLYGLFNPYGETSEGRLVLYDPGGKAVKDVAYTLKPRSSLMFDLRSGNFVRDIKAGFASDQVGAARLGGGGTIAVTNSDATVKAFGYLLIRRPGTARFSIDHPIHQSPFRLVKAQPPFDAEGKFRLKNILYTPLVFNSKKIGDVTLNSRFHFSSGSPIEEHLWMSPFVTDPDGGVAWQPTAETKLPAGVAADQAERGALKLARNQSCIFDCAQTSLPADFSGGLSLAISPQSNHTLMKIEVRVAEWGAHAITHFRPGLAAAKAYQRPTHRGGLVTDYITTAARLQRSASEVTRDTVVAIVNIDDKGKTGNPTIEVFSRKGLMASVRPGELPGFACRHYLLSELLPEGNFPEDLTLRMIDDQTIMLMSIVHLDYVRRDIALDHGSDRFSTFQDFNCDPG